jgi:hypothetical protein
MYAVQKFGLKNYLHLVVDQYLHTRIGPKVLKTSTVSLRISWQHSAGIKGVKCVKGGECEIVVHFCTDHITDDGLEFPFASRWQGGEVTRMEVTNGVKFYICRHHLQL